MKVRTAESTRLHLARRPGRDSATAHGPDRPHETEERRLPTRSWVMDHFFRMPLRRRR